MREIKFSYILQQEETGYFTEKIFDYLDIFSGKAKEFFSGEMRRWAIIAKREYTGLKDKNGKEIYEGDICNNGAVVKFIGGRYILKYIRGWEYLMGENDEVIGNIYVNPELLKK